VNITTPAKQITAVYERPLGGGAHFQPLRHPVGRSVRYNRPVVTIYCPYCETGNNAASFPNRCHGCYAMLDEKGARRPSQDDLRKLKAGDARKLLWALCGNCGKPGATEAACQEKLDLIGDSRPCTCCPACRSRCQLGG